MPWQVSSSIPVISAVVVRNYNIWDYQKHFSLGSCCFCWCSHRLTVWNVFFSNLTTQRPIPPTAATVPLLSPAMGCLHCPDGSVDFGGLTAKKHSHHLFSIKKSRPKVFWLSWEEERGLASCVPRTTVRKEFQWSDGRDILPFTKYHFGSKSRGGVPGITLLRISVSQNLWGTRT